MAKSEIVWTPTATQQLKEIVIFWNRHNNSNTFSKKLLKTVNKTLKTISSFPFLFRKTDFIGVRVAFIFGNFSIFYRIKDNTIEVLLFWDNRKDPERLNDLMIDVLI